MSEEEVNSYLKPILERVNRAESVERINMKGKTTKEILLDLAIRIRLLEED